MTQVNVVRRRIGVVLTAALLLGMLTAGPALSATAAPDGAVEVPDAVESVAVSPEGDGDETPTTRSQGDDMIFINGDSDAAPRSDSGFDESGMPLAEALSVSNHLVNVAVVAPSDTSAGTAFISDAKITDLLARVGASWKTQSNNQVQSVALSGKVQRFTGTSTCSNPLGTWGEAAARFGRSNISFYTNTPSVHLLVLVPSTCPESGLGTVGNGSGSASAGYGGLIWVSLKGYGDVDTVTHEFGHNLGLNHSNSHQCPAATMSEGLIDSTTGAFSDGCVDYSYGDYFDVMGPTWTVGGANGVVYANARPTALNVTHKMRLSATTSGEVATMSLPAGSATSVKSFTLASVGQTSGLRDVRVTDPRTKRVYFVDFRGGGGTDAGSLYESGKLISVGTAKGVRVLTTRPNGSSIVLNSPEKSPRTGSKLYLLAGETLSTRSSGVKVAVTTVANGSATVSITVAATANPTPKVSFNSQGGTTVAPVVTKSGSAIKAPKSPTRTGYTFTGWYTKSTGGTAWTFTSPVRASMTLYAQWTVQKRTVTFNSWGGSKVAAAVVNYGTVIKAPKSPTRTGYTFKGWYTKSTGGSAWKFSVKVTANATAYANWTKK